MSEQVISDIDKLYLVADDNECDVLDRLKEKAGLTWEHRSDNCRWTNLKGEDCDHCGMSEDEARRKGEV